MCRSIKTLHRPVETTTEAEIEAAALQYVRKISGYRKPSRPNSETFDEAVAEVAVATAKLLRGLEPRDRGVRGTRDRGA
ncbi:MAG: DUF2277 domain-containing protein [Candidatus Dormibacteria bacterium]